MNYHNYVDDSIISGGKQLIEETITSLEEVFKVKVQRSLDNYLGCKNNQDKQRFKIGQER
jgi:hypothetical protein